MQKDTPWTEFTIATLRKLWDDDVSTAEIGRRLNVSKNAAIGKAHRLKLPARLSPIKSVPTQQHFRGSLRPRRVPPTNPGPPSEQRAFVALATAAEPLSTETTTPSTTFSVAPNLWMFRSGQQCSWPIGDPGTPNFRFCDSPTVPGKPYCEAHARLAYAKTPSRLETKKRNRAAG